MLGKHLILSLQSKSNIVLNTTVFPSLPTKLIMLGWMQLLSSHSFKSNALVLWRY